MIRYWHGLKPKPDLSRSRPYHKNDNRFVEQKNSTLVRAYLGYDRLDTVAQTQAVNELYEKMWLYYNFFQPVLRLAEKTVSRAEGRPARVKRRYDQARTPFDRLCETKALSEERQKELQALRDRTNPRQLRIEIYEMIDCIAYMPGATPGVTEDVYQTLTTHSGPEQPGRNGPTPGRDRREKTLGKEGTPLVTLSIGANDPPW
jgi:hypothetical protein